MEKIDISQLEGEEKSLEIKYLIARYLRHWPWYILFIILLVIGTYFFHRYTVNEYMVSGTIVIRHNSKPETRILDRSAIFSSQNSLDNDILMLSSKNLAREALAKLHFDVTYFAKTNIKTIELYNSSPIRIAVDWSHMQIQQTPMQVEILSESTFKILPESNNILDIKSGQSQNDELLFDKIFKFGEEIETSKSKFTIHLVNPSRVGETIIFELRSPTFLEEKMAKAISIHLVNSAASVLEIRMTTTIIDKGRDYINALMESYLEYELREKNRISENTLVFIEDQLELLEDSLKRKERELQDFKVSNRMVNVTAEFSEILTRINQLDDDAKALDLELAYFNSIKQYMEEKTKDYSQVIAPSVIGIPDPLLNGLIQTLVTLSQERRKLLASVNENHPEVSKVDVQMEKVRETLFENVINLIENTEKKRVLLSENIRNYDRRFETLPESESRYTSIYREYRLRENLYTYLLEKRAEAGIAKASNVSDNAILDYAKQGKLVFPKKESNYLMAIGLGFLIPFGFFLIRDMLDNRIRDQRDLKKSFMIPQLAIIGHSEKETNMVVLEHPKSSVSESFRSLRSAINYIASDKVSKKILVTSSVSGEGKTFTSLNLASIMALGGKKTVVVGADLRRPKLASYFNHVSKTGLSNYLIGEISSDEIIMPSSHENLFFVPSGIIPPNPAELLQTQKLKDFIRHLEGQFDIVVFDTPPLGLVSETVDLMRLFDINLYVVRQDYTLKNHLVMINDLFNNKQVNNVYGIFNGIIDAGYYYEGYNYGYGNTYLYTQNNKYIYNYFGEEDSPKSSKINQGKSAFSQIWNKFIQSFRR
ncbi:polysaccharide biosynthesis tyrosine autokinase [Belliella sp. DSM 111904]|uniref:non-specific protein-tyrosine kinase n=1 Tax=Belliella filtrata TaxID=2923435 RepID=A0ABS9V1E0_9BACT|nr:polysaccharide biosynthesis tyrosine autokinase [Belliella filtrata]MCH7410232.1 polysaccharide biosynthesis tyrosine autokinase [Belliella filtrata]